MVKSIVTPDEMGDLSHSLVRIPGTGYDRSAIPLIHNLERVVATIPINPQIPNTIAPHPSENEASVIKLSTLLDRMTKPNASSESQCRRRSDQIQTSTATCPAVKRAKMIYLTPQEALYYTSRPRPIGGYPQGSNKSHRRLVPSQRSLQKQQQYTTTTNPTAEPQEGDTKLYLEQLLRQQCILRQENERLQHQNSVFHRLFQNQRRQLNNLYRCAINTN